MSEATRMTVNGEGWDVRCIQALEEDPLFDGVRYRFSVESGGRALDLVVVASAIFVSLLTLPQRRRLRAAAEQLVQAFLEAGHRHDATIRISGDGVAMLGEERLAELLPLHKPAVAAGTAH